MAFDPAFDLVVFVLGEVVGVAQDHLPEGGLGHVGRPVGFVDVT